MGRDVEWSACFIGSEPLQRDKRLPIQHNTRPTQKQFCRFIVRPTPVTWSATFLAREGLVVVRHVRAWGTRAMWMVERHYVTTELRINTTSHPSLSPPSRCNKTTIFLGPWILMNTRAPRYLVSNCWTIHVFVSALPHLQLWLATSWPTYPTFYINNLPDSSLGLLLPWRWRHFLSMSFNTDTMS